MRTSYQIVTKHLYSIIKYENEVSLTYNRNLFFLTSVPLPISRQSVQPEFLQPCLGTTVTLFTSDSNRRCNSLEKKIADKI